jgi:hypothetical protein
MAERGFRLFKGSSEIKRGRGRFPGFGTETAWYCGGGSGYRCCNNRDWRGRDRR